MNSTELPHYYYQVNKNKNSHTKPIMKTPFAALLTFALLNTSNAAYQCLDSAPNLYCCQNHPFVCQIRASPFSTYLSPPFRQLQLTASSISIVRNPDQDPSKPPGASYQPADLNAFAAACTRLNGASWPACCYVDGAIVGWPIYFACGFEKGC